MLKGVKTLLVIFCLKINNIIIVIIKTMSLDLEIASNECMYASQKAYTTNKILHVIKKLQDKKIHINLCG